MARRGANRSESLLQPRRAMKWLRGFAAASIVGCLISVGRPFASAGFPTGHDAPAHLTYTYLFDRAIAQGQLPVRWTEWVRSGHGQPLFNFYQPGIYYIVEAIHETTGAGLSNSLKLSVLLSWWTGGLLTFLLLRRFGRWPAALAAVLFVFSPYSMLDVFVRSAYPELASLSFAPGVLWSIDRLLRGARAEHVFIGSAFVCLMLVCHLPTFLIFVPLFVAYIPYVIWSLASEPGEPRRTGAAVISIVILVGLGAGMAAFYVFPALSERKLIRLTALTTGYFEYLHHFVAPAQWVRWEWGFGSSVDGPDDGMSFQIGILQWIVIIAGIATTVALATRKQLDRRAGWIAFWLGGVAFAMIMMTAASQPLWSALPALSYLQFPWRYLMLISLSCAASAAVLLSKVRNEVVQIAIVLVALVGQLSAARPQHSPKYQIPPGEMNIDDPLWSRTVSEKTAYFEDAYSPVAASEPSAPGIGRWTVMSGRAVVQEVRVEDDQVVLDVDVADSREGAIVSINSRVFPGWSARLDRNEAQQAASGSGTGFITVRVPPGRHRLEVEFRNTPIRSLGNLVSVCSLGVCLAGLAVSPLIALHIRRRGTLPVESQPRAGPV